jgi:hypothetical protein
MRLTAHKPILFSVPSRGSATKVRERKWRKPQLADGINERLSIPLNSVGKYRRRYLRRYAADEHFHGKRNFGGRGED